MITSRAASAAAVPKDRDELIARNRALTGALAESARAARSPNALAEFRALSGRYQRGEVSGTSRPEPPPVGYRSMGIT